MNKKIVIFLLILAGTLMSSRILLQGAAEYSDDHSWLVTLIAEFTVTDVQSARISLKQPFETDRIRVNQRTLNHAGLQQVYRKLKGQVDRDITFRPRGPGEHFVSASFALQTSEHARFFNITPTELSDKDREKFTTLNASSPFSEQVYQEIDDQLSPENTAKDELPEQLLRFLFNLPTREINDVVAQSEQPVLDVEQLSLSQKAMLMVEVCRRMSIPARLVTGFLLRDDPDAQPTWWVEAFQNNAWYPYYPETGAMKTSSSRYVAIDKSGQGVVAYKNLDSITWTTEIEELPQSAMNRDIGQRHWHDVFNLSRLPADIREQLVLLALLPLGALITAIVRQYVGVHSYGVFTPTMLALAMIYTSAVTTMIILLVIAVAVYIGKPAMHPTISRTPRLSIIFVVVALGMLLGISVLDYAGLGTDGHLILLPIVILTGLVDRFLLTMEKEGQFVALYRLFWTSIISLMIMPVLGLEWLGYQFLGYPEMHLVTIALLLLMADYKGTKVIDNRYLKLVSETHLKTRFRRPTT